MTYDAFRKNGGPTLYGPFKTAVTADVLEAGLIFAACILAFSLLLMLPGYTGRQIIFQTVKIIIGVFVTASILLCNFGQEWEVAHVTNALTQYKAGVNAEIHADVEAKIGLRSINVTLKAVPEYQTFPGGVEERIDYNERFHWDSSGWLQGRSGFGPFAGLVNQEYREAQRKGLPYPILWVAEYFVLDGEGIRWGRHYLQAGWYSHIMIWLAFPLWLLTMVLFHLVLPYGAYMSILTGLVLLTANIIYGTLRNPLQLEIPINDQAFLHFEWGWCFYMNLFTGLLCVALGGLTWICHILWFEKINAFFGSDFLQEYDEYYLDPKDIEVTIDDLPLKHDNRTARTFKKSIKHSNRTNGAALEMTEADQASRRANSAVNATVQRRFKRKSDALAGRFQRSKKYQSRPLSPHGTDNLATTVEDHEMYENVDNEGTAANFQRPTSGPTDNAF